MKRAFHPTELEEQPTAKTDLEADMASECAKLGPIDKVPGFATHSTLQYP